MPLLILAITSFLVVVAIVVPLIADTLESRAIRYTRDLASTQPPLLSISEAFVLSIRFFGKLRLLLWS